MKKVDLFKIGIEELSANKLRTFLTMMGIIFGVGSVISMLSIGEGAKRETLEQIDLLGSNNIIVKAEEIEKEEGKINTFPNSLAAYSLNVFFFMIVTMVVEAG